MKSQMGLGYRAPFHEALIPGHPDIGWLEIITENYLWDRGARRQNLEKLRQRYDLAFHGVTLSLATPLDFDEQYLLELKRFADEFQPVRISDHLCWSSNGSHHWHDLLPFPYTDENLHLITVKVNRWQDALKRPLVLENLSAYIASKKSIMSEYAFLAELCRRTGCQILLDLNNMVVNARNFRLDPLQELAHLSLKSVAQVHLAGFVEGEHFAIDTHSRAPNEDTWKLWERVCQQRADIPYMLEWDSDIPEFTVAKEILDKAAEIARRNT